MTLISDVLIKTIFYNWSVSFFETGMFFFFDIHLVLLIS